MNSPVDAMIPSIIQRQTAKSTRPSLSSLDTTKVARSMFNVRPNVTVSLERYVGVGVKVHPIFRVKHENRDLARARIKSDVLGSRYQS